MGEVANIPQLRFPEFDQPLLTDILLNLTDVLRCGIAATPKYVDSGITFLSSQNVTPTGKILMDKCNFISEDYYKKISKNAKLLKGDILYSRVGARYGNAAIFPFEGDYGVYVSLTHIRASQKLDNTFLKFLLNSPIGKTQAKKGVFQGGGVPNLNVKVVEKFKINFPSKPEQQKIAAFLTAVDAKIEQLIKKKELLDEYKKGLMQQIFSQAIRFKADDGSDFPDWKENKVDEFMEVTRGQVLAVPEMRQVESEIFKYPVYSSQTKNNGLTGYYTDYLFEDCITWTTDGANAGDVNYRAGKFYCTNVCGVLRSKKGYANLCIAQILNSVSRRYVSYVGNPKLMNNVMEKIKISIPSSINEQTKIANFLSSVDSKIEEVGKQLDESKQFKKALLQKMFV